MFEPHRLAGGMVSPGVFEFTGVPAGRYAVRTVGSTGVQQSTEVDLANDGQELDGSAGEPTGSLVASVRILNEAKLPPQLRIGLLGSERTFVAAQPVDSKGEVRIEGIAPGKYSVVAAASSIRVSGGPDGV